MASTLRRIGQPAEWKPKARRNATLVALFSGPLALVLVLLLGLITVASFSKVPKPVDTYAAITEATKVQNFARNALLQWLGGTTTTEKPLLAKSSAAQTISLSPVPFEVLSIDPSDIERIAGTDAAQWRVVLAATINSPGAASPQMNRYALTVIDRDGDFQLLTWPYIVTAGNGTFTVSSRYTVPLGANSPLGQSVQQFASAYLTSSAGSSTQLGRFVSERFTGTAVADSPYTEVVVQEIRALEGSTPATAKPGTQVSVLARVKASASLQTWSVMDLPLRMSLSANNVWLPDGFDSPVRWGRIGEDVTTARTDPPAR